MHADEKAGRSKEAGDRDEDTGSEMNIEVEVSLYPLVEEYLEHPVHDFTDLLKKHGCSVEIGPMSSVVMGESSKVFEALRIGYERAARQSGCVLLIKACNVCPL